VTRSGHICSISCKRNFASRLMAGVLCVVVVTGCQSAPSQDPVTKTPSASPSLTPSVSASPAEAVRDEERPASRVEVPAADETSPSSVAEAFYVAYWSYDTAADTARSRTERINALATDALVEHESGARLPSAEWARAQEADEVAQISDVVSYVDPNAPSPDEIHAYYMVQGTRTITTTSGERTEQAPTKALLLLQHSGAWYVDQILL